MKLIDCYNKNSYMEYLEFMKTPMVFGTEYDIIMLCEFLKVSIKVFSPSLFSDKHASNKYFLAFSVTVTRFFISDISF